MNTAYKLVWNTVSNSWIVASELARGHKKSAGKSLKLALCIASALGASVAHAIPAPNTLPTGGSLSGNGVYSIDSSVPNQLTINQSEAALVAVWDSFSIGSNARVIFNQPSSNSFTFNRVTGGSPSEIFGQVQANGHFVLANPSGITFGAGSQVNAAAIVASANDMSHVLFLANAYGLQASSSATAKVENYGTLTATAGGVTLLGSQVVNAGNIIATGGDVRLLNAGSTNFNNGVPTSIGSSAITGFILNSGSVTATQVSSVGGRILLTGDTSQAASQIQLGGALDATTSTDVNGRSIRVTHMLDVNGTDNTLNLTHVDGYSLTGGPVNLNGSNSGFSVNGSAYTVIRDVTQLQAIQSNRSGRYVLANDIDASATSTWNAGAGFNPIGDFTGDGTTEFTGRLDGLGHIVNSLYINRPSEDDIAVFGAAYGADIRNIGLNNVNVRGRQFVAGLISDSGINTVINNSYVSGSISGNSYAGGLVGSLYTNSTLSNSSSSAAVSTSSGYAGGLTAMMINSFISGSYASGAVTTNSGYLGGLAGQSVGGNISNSYWNITTSQRPLASGNDSFGASQTNVVGLTDAQSKQLSSYANWGSDIDAQAGTGALWRIYDGQSAPLLRTFLKPVTISGDYSKTYDATAFNGAYQLAAGTDSSKLLGTALFGGTAIGAVNAGSYSQSVSGLYSGQDGYDIGFVDGTVTINKASLSITATDASKVYDGTTAASSTAVIVGGNLFGTDTLNGATFNYDDKNAGTGKHLIVSNALISDNNNGGNYAVTYVDNTSSSISKRLLTISAVADSKEYDGRISSSLRPLITGRLRGDSIAGLTQSYLDKNAGTGKTINVDAGFVIRDGNSGNNYDVVIVNSNAGVITPKALSISTVANSKVYDGGTTSANKPLVTGLLMGDRITGLFQQYETKTVGENKKLLIKSGYVLQDGNNGGNYTVTEQTSTDGVISTH